MAKGEGGAQAETIRGEQLSCSGGGSRENYREPIFGAGRIGRKILPIFLDVLEKRGRPRESVHFAGGADAGKREKGGSLSPKAGKE